MSSNHKWDTVPDDDFLRTTKIAGLTYCERCGQVQGRDDIRIRVRYNDPNPGAFVSEGILSFNVDRIQRVL